MTFDPKQYGGIPSNERDTVGEFNPSKFGAEPSSYQGEVFKSGAETQKPKRKGIFSSVTDILAGAEKGLAQTFGNTMFALSGGDEQMNEAAIRESESRLQLAQKLKDPTLSEGQKFRIKRQLRQGISTQTAIEGVEGFDKNTKQIVGEAIGTLVDIMSFGTYGRAAQGAKSFVYLKRTRDATKVKAAKAMAEAYLQLPKGQRTWKIFSTFLRGATRAAPRGAAFGGGQALSLSMMNDDDAREILEKTKSGVIFGGSIAAVMGGVGEVRYLTRAIKAEKLKAKAVEAYKRGVKLSKIKYKEKRDKIIPELLDRNWWGTRKGLLEKAMSGKKLSAKQYEQLGELSGIVELDDFVTLIDSIDERISSLQIKGTTQPITGQKSAIKTLESLKDDILTVAGYYADESYLMISKKAELVQGYIDSIDDKILADKIRSDRASIVERALAYDELVNKGVAEEVMWKAEYEDLRHLAQSYGELLYEGRRALSVIEDNRTLSQIKLVDGSIREVLGKANPEYAEINKLYHASTELLDILIESDAVRESTWQTTVRMLGYVAAALAAGFGVGGSTQRIDLGVAGAAAATGLIYIYNTTWFSTLTANQQNKMAEALLEKGPDDMFRWIHIISAQGMKGYDALME